VATSGGGAATAGRAASQREGHTIAHTCATAREALGRRRRRKMKFDFLLCLAFEAIYLT